MKFQRIFLVFHLPCSASLSYLSPQSELKGSVEGSYKIRGVINMFHKFTAKYGSSKPPVVSMSAGNFGRSFAFMTAQLGIPCKVAMPETVPEDRIKAIKRYGASIVLAPKQTLQAVVDDLVAKENYTFCHPFDSIDLFEGYGSIGLEILQDLPDADIVDVPVGGGGLISGIASAIKMSGSSAKIVGVEPEGAPSMLLSLQRGYAVTLDKIETFVNGLSPPYAGKNCYQVVKQFVDEIVTVSDQQITDACVTLYTKHKTVVEFSACASVAALINQKGKILGDVAGKKVVCILSGGNISPAELIAVQQYVS